MSDNGSALVRSPYLFIYICLVRVRLFWHNFWFRPSKIFLVLHVKPSGCLTLKGGSIFMSMYWCSYYLLYWNKQKPSLLHGKHLLWVFSTERWFYTYWSTLAQPLRSNSIQFELWLKWPLKLIIPHLDWSLVLVLVYHNVVYMGT